MWLVEVGSLGDARTYSLPENFDDVGVVWEHKSGYEPRQGAAVHVHTVVDVEQFNHRLIPPFYRGGQPVVQGRIPCDTSVCLWGGGYGSKP